jgi:hypothetical protein
MRRLPDWLIPVAFFGVAIIIAGALWAVGDGRDAGTWGEEVHAARQLFHQERRWPEQTDGIEVALRSLDPTAVEAATQGGP